jgi:hypothetical protein
MAPAKKREIDHRDEVLDSQVGPDYQPNTLEGRQEGPTETVSPNLYHHYRKPDGSDFVAPASSRAQYEAKGFTVSGDETIDNWVEYWDAQQKGKTSKRDNYRDAPRGQVGAAHPGASEEQAHPGATADQAHPKAPPEVPEPAPEPREPRPVEAPSEARKD